MDKLAQQINSDKNFKSEAYQYMNQEFDKERAKPIEERDFEKLERLSSEMCELLDGGVPHSSEDSKARLFEIISEKDRKNKVSMRRFKKIIPAIIVAATLMAANCISVLAWNMNIVSAIIEITKGGFSVDFGKNEAEVIELPTSEDDPYGIIAECAKYDIYPETTHYLPEGFVLCLNTSNVSSHSNYAKFVFRNADNQSITFTFTRYWDNVDKTGIPSDDFNITETMVNGKSAIVSKEDNQYTITFQSEKTVFLMFTQDVPYEICEEIVNSIK